MSAIDRPPTGRGAAGGSAAGAGLPSATARPPGCQPRLTADVLDVAPLEGAADRRLADGEEVAPEPGLPDRVAAAAEEPEHPAAGEAGQEPPHPFGLAGHHRPLRMAAAAASMSTPTPWATPMAGRWSDSAACHARFHARG